MIMHEDVDGRMLAIIMQHYTAGHAMRYLPLTNLLIFEWRIEPNARGNGGYTDKSVCRLDAWFTDAAQDYIIDLIYPRL